MTDPTTPVDAHDPNPDEPRIDSPRCVTCGEPIEEGMAGWEHRDKAIDADHEAVGRDAE